MRVKKTGRVLVGMILCLVLTFSGLQGEITAFAQDEESFLDVSTDGYMVNLYNNTNGMPTSEANAVVQIADGFLYIGGYAGLTQFDGKEFMHFDATTGISAVASLCVDSQDRLWIGTNDSGVALYEKGEVTFWGKEQGLRSLSVRSIVEDPKGNLILATTSGLAYIDRAGKLGVIEDERLDEQYIGKLVLAQNGAVCGITSDGDIFSVRDCKVSRYVPRDSVKEGMITAIWADENGFLYLGNSEDKLFRVPLQGNTQQVDSYTCEGMNMITAICQVGKHVWVCANNGIGYFDEEFRFVKMENLPLTQSVSSVMEDEEGNLWFTSTRQGVMEITRNRFSNLSERVGLEENVINSVCRDGDLLYVGMDTGLALVKGEKKLLNNTLTKRMAGIRIRCIRQDSKGNIWMCTNSDQGVVCYTADGKYRSYNTGNGLNSDWTRAVIELSNGDIAISSSGGVNLIRNGKVIRGYNAKDGLVNEEILTICEGENGILYAGSDGGGIYVIDGEKVTNLNTDTGLRSDVILRIKKNTERGGYWIITSNSIAYMSNGTINTISNFPYSNNFDIFSSANGDVWILSSNGVYVVNEDKMLQNDVSEYQFYNLYRGLPCTPTGNSRSYLDEEGNLYIAGCSDVVKTNINENTVDTDSIKLSVPCVMLDDQMVYLDDETTVQVPSDCKRVTIYGYALSYTMQNPEITYCLNGFSADTDTTTKQELAPISYTNLKGGKYTFTMSVLDEDTGKIKSQLKLEIVKEKELTEHGWFQGLLIAFGSVIVIFVAVLWIRNRTLKMLEREKHNRVFTNQLMEAMGKLVDTKDKFTRGHTLRVAKYSAMIARQLGYNEEETENVRNVALLHDIGLLLIPEDIINKMGARTEDEERIYRTHTALGFEMLESVTCFPELAKCARDHHDYMDGSGYPFGVVNTDLNKYTKIVMVADTFDDMSSTNPNQPKKSMPEIVEQLRQMAGKELDAKVVQIFVKILESVEMEEEL